MLIVHFHRAGEFVQGHCIVEARKDNLMRRVAFASPTYCRMEDVAPGNQETRKSGVATERASVARSIHFQKEER